jgi:putative PIN family toxin of toxin-antitoxin system
MKITLDTNVLVSAFISKQGQPAALLDIILTFPKIELVLSDPILAEFKDVLSRPEVKERFKYSKRKIGEFVDAIRNVSTIVELRSDFRVVVDDPKDDVIINTAYDGKVDFVVSGDTQLLKLKGFRGIRIVKPRAMLDIMGRRFGEFVISGRELEL